MTLPGVPSAGDKWISINAPSCTDFSKDSQHRATRNGKYSLLYNIAERTLAPIHDFLEGITAGFRLRRAWECMEHENPTPLWSTRLWGRHRRWTLRGHLCSKSLGLHSRLTLLTWLTFANLMTLQPISGIWISIPTRLPLKLRGCLPGPLQTIHWFIQKSP